MKGNSIKLVGEIGDKDSGSYLFAYDNPDKESFTVGFIYDYDKEDGVEKRYEDQLVGSIYNHCPDWDEPTTELTPEELERIVNLPVYRG